MVCPLEIAENPQVIEAYLGEKVRPHVSMLALDRITAGYGAFTALWDVSLRVEAGEAVAVVGPNGRARPRSCA